MSQAGIYFSKGPLGCFLGRVKKRFAPRSAQITYHGVRLQLDCLSPGMQEVLRNDFYEIPEMRMLQGFVGPEDKVLEIGGAIGFIGLFCKKILGVRQLTSVEPNPHTLSCLRRNYELNGLVPSVIEAALAAADGPVPLQTSDMLWTDSVVIRKNLSAAVTITVAGLSWGVLAERAGFSFDTLIVDIEGGELYFPLEALPGHVRKIIIELHPDLIGIRTAYGVLETLIKAGFQVQNNFEKTWALERKG